MTTTPGLDVKKTLDSAAASVGGGGGGGEEDQLKMLRVLVNLVDNRRCFDCNQPGPTYVNVTIGAYVCTACSGRLYVYSTHPPFIYLSISVLRAVDDCMYTVQYAQTLHLSMSVLRAVDDRMYTVQYAPTLHLSDCDTLSL